MNRDLILWAVDLAVVALVIWLMFLGTGQTVEAVIVAVKGMLL